MIDLSQIPFLFSLVWVYFAARELLQDARAIWRDRPYLLPFVVAFIDKLLSCSRCFAFWLSFVLTRDLVLAVFVAIAFELYFSIRLRLQ